MKTICFLNEKGGCGKTTLALHVAAGLAIKGKRVILMDGDAQANATSALGLTKEPALHDLLVRNATWRESLRLVHPDVYGLPNAAPAGQLFAVPGNVETRNIANTISDGLIVKKRLTEIEAQVDYVIIDTSPSPSLFHSSLLVATDYVIMPTQAEAFSAFEGLSDSILHGDVVREAALRQGLLVAQVAGIVPTMYRAKTVAHRDTLNYLLETYGAAVWQPLTMSILYAEAMLLRQLIFGYKPKSSVAKELWDVINRIERIGVTA